jgi:hypothetical protein
MTVVALAAATSMLLAHQGVASAESAPDAELARSGGAAPGSTDEGHAGARTRRSYETDSSSESESKSKSRSRSRSRSRSKKSKNTSVKKPSSRSTKTSSRKPRRKRSREVTATVDVGVGPAFYAFGNPLSGGALLSGPIYEDQPWHYGLRFDAAAIIDYEFYRQNRHLVPRKYRGMFKPDTEIRYAPAAVALIPRNIYFSPKTKNTGVYGATWELARLGLSLVKTSSTRLSVGAGALLTYAYIDSDVFESTHFLRPGASVGVELGTMFSDTWGMSLGWDSNFYLPQNIGGSILEGDDDDALWHVGEGFLMIHYRFPYTTKL